MSSNPLELFTGYTHGANHPHATASERRKRTRIRVHWPVLLFRAQVGEAITSTTLDLSSSGFYCVTAVPLTPGDALACTLKVPFHDPNGKHLDRILECTVRVVRVEPKHTDSSFGVACHIEDYHFADFKSCSPC